MAPGGGSRSGRSSRIDTTVYTAARTASEAIQSRAGWRVARCILQRLSVDGAHDLLVLEHLLRISGVDDLAAVDRVQLVRHPAGVRQVRLRDQDRQLHLLDL